MAALTAETFAREVAAALGGRLGTLLLYGSAARGTHVRKRGMGADATKADRVLRDLARLGGGSPETARKEEVENRLMRDAKHYTIDA